MKSPTAFLSALILSSTLLTAEAAPAPPTVLPLWPQGAPGESGNIGEERDMTKPTDNLVGGRPLIRLGNVTTPTISIFRPEKAKDTGASVVVCPGGGYNILAWDLEGTEVCEWLNSIGVTGVLLKYRVPRRPDREPYAAPLQDAQRAIGLVRSHAEEWGIDPKRVGILGFSAGGHLSAAASTNYRQRTYSQVDAADEQSCRPDFTILIYPAYLTKKEEPTQLSPELKQDAQTPPAFLVHAQDDGIAAENSIFYYLGLKKLKLPSEVHVFPTGGHGYGLRPTEHAVTGWPKLAEQWLRGRGFLKQASIASAEPR